MAVVKTASVRVSAGDLDEVYRSLEEIPEGIRRQIRQALNGPNAETIVIADQGGREQIFQVIQDLPPHLRKRALAAIRVAVPQTPGLSIRTRWLLVGAGAAALTLFLFWLWYW